MSREPGWYTDPYFLNHERYWDGTWTDRIRRIEAEQLQLRSGAAGVADRLVSASTAERTSEARELVTTAVRAGDAKPRPDHAAGAVSAALSAKATLEKPAEPDTATYPAVSGVDVAAGTAPPTAPTPIVHEDDTLVVPVVAQAVDTVTVPAVPAVSGTDAMVEKRVPTSPQPLPWETSTAAQEEARAIGARGRRRRLGLVGGALVLVVVVVLGAVFVAGGSGGNNGTPPQHLPTAAKITGGTQTAARAPAQTPSSPHAVAALVAAADKSLGKHSASASVVLAPADPSQPIPEHVSGSGAFLLDPGTGRVDFALSGAAKTEVQSLLFQGQNAYISVTDSPVPGTSWVAATTSNLPALGPSLALSSLVLQMGNPGLMIKELSSTPMTVATLASGSIDGMSVDRYGVRFTSDPTTLSASGFGAHSSEEVDVNATNHHVRQIVMPGSQIDVNGQSVQEVMVVGFSHYGKPVTIAPPPLNELVSLSQYLARPAPASAQPGVSGNS